MSMERIFDQASAAGLANLDADSQLAGKFSTSDELVVSDSFANSLGLAAETIGTKWKASVTRAAFGDTCFTSETEAESCARTFIRTFGKKAFRRTITDPDVAGLLPVYLETLARDTPGYADLATVFTVHNLAYQGVFWHYDLPMTGLGWDLFTPAGLEFYGHLSLLKGGLVFADLLTTVSPTYAREIQSPEFGERMDGILRERSADLTGILNGLDVQAWNPATDGDLPKRYDRDDLDGKAACAAALRSEMGLPEPGRRTPLVGVVSRLAEQKGIDLVAGAVPAIRAAGAQLVVLGSGEAPLEQLLGELALAHPESVAVRIGFDERLARRIYAGTDLFLMPSRYEPCGLGQLIALRYGTVPIVRRTGGLADTVRPWNGATGGTGFLFDELSAEACGAALARAFAVHADAAAWRHLVGNGMAADFSWDASAESYVTCYRRAIKKARRHA